MWPGTVSWPVSDYVACVTLCGFVNVALESCGNNRVVVYTLSRYISEGTEENHRIS